MIWFNDDVQITINSGNSMEYRRIIDKYRYPIVVKGRMKTICVDQEALARIRDQWWCHACWDARPAEPRGYCPNCNHETKSRP